MRKRERENPCFVCGHYHKFEDGEVCGICGHRLQEATEKGPQQSAFSTEILPQFLYLGSYDNASRAELLKTQNITRILNTVPTCQNLYKNSFTYHSLKEDKTLPFVECLEFIGIDSAFRRQQTWGRSGSGQNYCGSPAVVIAYLMKHKQWRLPQSYQWVKDRRPSINLTEAVAQQLQQFEIEVFGNNVTSTPIYNTPAGVTFGFGYSAPVLEAIVPTFTPHPVANTLARAPVFGSVGVTVLPKSNFVFGAIRHEPKAAMDQSMDSS
ncbi:protein-tyrosine-phosphatase IBR5 isoform X1 [Physcomitrium patens]|uniref:protein-tyrosine-phosphatase IBR5 isoform X1 n=1 Tax=Physcomitrium patens TaxID=3218 RepID=UPI003CCC997E